LPTSLGPAEIMVILIVALIVLGPKRLPEAGRQVGKAIAEVRKWSQGFQDEIRGVVNPDNSPPSYAQPQPGYDPPPIPIVPAETAPAPTVDASPPPAETNGSTTSVADAQPDPQPSEPSEPAGPPAGEPPRS